MTACVGIEAGCAILFSEISKVLSADGNYINFRHLDLLVRTIAVNGFMCPVSRHGMARSDAKPLLRASFEQTVKVMLEAAVFNETDDCKGVTSAIILGKLSQIGSGAVEIVAKAQPVFKGRRRAQQALAAPAPAVEVRYWDPHVDPRVAVEALLAVTPPPSPGPSPPPSPRVVNSPPFVPSTSPPHSPPHSPLGSPPHSPLGSPPRSPLGSPPHSPLGSPPRSPLGSPPAARSPPHSPPTGPPAASPYLAPLVCDSGDELLHNEPGSFELDAPPAAYRFLTPVARARRCSFQWLEISPPDQ